MAPFDDPVLEPIYADVGLGNAGGDWVQRFWKQPPEVTGSALMLLIRRCRDYELPDGVLGLLNRPGRRRWSISRSDALLAARTAAALPDERRVAWALRAAEILVRREASAEPFRCEEETAVIRALMASLEYRTMLTSNERAAMRRNLLGLLADPGAATVDTSCISPVDGWAACVLPELGTLGGDVTAVNALLRHLATAPGSAPSDRWLTETARLLESPQALAVLRLMFDRLADAEPVLFVHAPGWNIEVVLEQRNTDLARAVVWASVHLTEPGVTTRLHRIAMRELGHSTLTGFLPEPGEKVAGACIRTLGSIATGEAVAELHDLAARTRHKERRRRIDSALTQAAELTGLTPVRLAEPSVPDCGLGPDGVVTLSSGTTAVRIAVDDELNVTVSWNIGDGQWTRRLPAAAPTADVKALKAEVKDLKVAIERERRRLEELFTWDHHWSVTHWRRHYLDHPVTGRFTRRLIWRFTPAGGAPVTGVPDDAGLLAGPEGTTRLPQTGSVALWQPALADAPEVDRWRTWTAEHRERRQPLEQAFRAAYRLTSTELVTDTGTRRHADRILDRFELYRALKRQGWAAKDQPLHEGGRERRARRDFLEARVTAVLEFFAADLRTRRPLSLTCTTGAVWFAPMGDRADGPLALGDVPPLVFSETMRDVALFADTTSVGDHPRTDRP